jgi:mannosyltransferase
VAATSYVHRRVFAIRYLASWTELGLVQLLPRTVHNGWSGRPLLAGLTLVALALRLPRIDDSLGGDELFAYSEIHGRGPIGVVEAVQDSIEVTPPLFFILAWATSKLGDPTIFIRVPSLLLGVALVPLTYLLGVRTVGKAAGLLAAALVALSPFAIRFSTQGRPYATLMFCVALSTLALIVAIDRRGRRWWALYAAASAAVLYTHYTGVFALAAQTAWAAWKYPELLRPLATATGSAAVLFLPWLPQVGAKGQLDNPLYGVLTVDNIGRTLVEVFPGYPQQSPSHGRLAGIQPLIAISLAMLVSLLGLVYRVRRSRPTTVGAPRILLLAAVVAAAPAGMLGFSLISGHNVFQGRYLSASFPALALLIAALVFAVRPRVAAVVTGVVVVGVAVGAVKILSPDLRAAEYRKPARYVDAHARPGDVVVQQAGRSTGPLSTALTVHFERPHRVVTVTGVKPVAKGFEATVDPEVWRRAAANHKVFVIGPENALYVLPRPPRSWAPHVRLLSRRSYPGVSRIHLYVYGSKPPGRDKRVSSSASGGEAAMNSLHRR